MSRLRIAVTQSGISRDVTRNGEAVRSAMRLAARNDARLVQFPEGMLSGYPKEQVRDWAQVDWGQLEHELDLIRVLARELGIWVVLGSAHRLTAPNRPHNSLYVIDDQGRIAERYDKRFCSHTEITDWFSPGFRPATFTVDGFRFGLLTCIEVNFPALFAEYEALGVDCVLLSAYPVDSIFKVKAQAHAAINNYWLALSVSARLSLDLGSCVFGPDGSQLTHASDEHPVAFADIDPDDPQFDIALTKARPWRARARHGDIYSGRRVHGDPRSADLTCV